MNLKVLAAGMAVVVPLVALLAVGFRYDPKQIDSPLVGRPAPGVTLPALDGTGSVSLDAYRGKPLVLNFWATWCVPCQAEHPALLAAAMRYQGKAAFVGVVYQDKPENIQAWLRDRGSAYPTLIDEGSRAAIAYGVYGVPETYVIDAAGTIVHKFTGPVDAPSLDAVLAPLVGGAG
jgi:cytochrome c biogenesis protein CcmG/thiol:disulfide interchange protein DsbE